MHEIYLNGDAKCDSIWKIGINWILQALL